MVAQNVNPNIHPRQNLRRHRIYPLCDKQQQDQDLEDQAMERPSTPPRAATGAPNPNPLTPEVTRRIEENRLKAKAIRDQKDAAARVAGQQSHSTPSGFVATDDIRIPNTRKRTYESISSNVPSTSRDGRSNGASPPASKDGAQQQQKDGDKEGAIRPARKFAKFVDYDFGKMTDTKGGFLSAEDDPWN
ncbi:hypothetical protein CHU98_g9008, partial [Xylaria longipes]